MIRNRYLYFLWILLTVGAGLTSRQFRAFFPLWVGDYLGDVLWALMVYFIFAFIFKSEKSYKVAIFSLLFSYGIEISQFCQAEWLNYIRNYKLGALILGFSFSWSDILCYTMGVSIGFLMEIMYANFKRKKELTALF